MHQVKRRTNPTAGRVGRRGFVRRLLAATGLALGGWRQFPRQGAARRQTPDAATPDPAAATMIAIEGGSYPIGSDAGGAAAQPAHTVTIDAFAIDQHEVTNAEFAAFLNTLNVEPRADAPAGEVRADDLPVEAGPLLLEGPEGAQQEPIVALDDEHSRIAIRDGRFVPEDGYADHPLVEVTWFGARDYCAWRGARLPTEVEWEAAARGQEGRTYPWGEDPPTPARAVFGRGSGETDPVGSHPAGGTPAGVQDLAGNVAEWTSSLYAPYPVAPADGRDDLAARGERVTRGGDHVFDSAPDQLTGFFRGGFSRAPDRGHRHIGFRCARSATSEGQ